MPAALERKYPNAAYSLKWQWVFPQERRWCDRKLKVQGRQGVIA